MKTLKFGLVAVSSLTLILTACPEVPNEIGTIPAKYSKIGTINHSSLGTTTFLIGTFYKYATAISQPATSFGLSEDTCMVIQNPDLSSNPFLTALKGITPLDAGTELTVKNASGTLATLKPQTNGGTIYKSYANDFTAIVPDVSGATIEIPGASGGFPTMTATLPAALAAFTSEPKTNITKDTAFTWTSPVASASVIIGATSGTGASAVSVYCVAKDDGGFTFSASTKAELDSKGFTTAPFPTVSRFMSISIPKDDALLFVQSSRGSNL
jgi:hypothetical protein